MGVEHSRPFDPSKPPARIHDRTLTSIANYILSNPDTRILFLVGAGISTAAGIPDFRSDSGLYSSLARLDLPTPEAIFDISYFRTDPRPFYALAQELWPGKYLPTITHCFMAVAAKQGRLLKVFTQNIDTLELAAGIPREDIVFAHGSFASQSCIDCKLPFTDRAEFEACVSKAQVVFCPDCGGLVKPDITFFGEALPKEFHESLSVIQQADLAIVMGSSLSVYPFALLPQRVPEEVPRVLLNMEKAGDAGARRDDVVWLGECDDGVRELAEGLGWWEEVEGLWMSFRGEEVREREKRKGLSRDEKLKLDVEEITKEVEKGLAVGEGHKSWVEAQLEKEKLKEIVDKEVKGEGKGGLDHVLPHLSTTANTSSGGGGSS